MAKLCPSKNTLDDLFYDALSNMPIRYVPDEYRQELLIRQGVIKPPRKYLTRKEVMQLLDIGKDLLTEMIYKKELDYIHCNNYVYRFSPEQFELKTIKPKK